MIIELIGLAGTGKTTLAAALYRDPRFEPATRLFTKNPRNLPYFVRHAYRTRRVLAGARGTERRLTWEETKKVVYLDGWHRRLHRQARAGNSVIVIDHGPIFELATLYAFGPVRLRRPELDPWWDELFARWASTLGLVVCLECPEEVILTRIRNCAQAHEIKHSHIDEARGFLRRYRASYDHVMSKLTRARGPRVLQIDTARQSAHEIANHVIEAVDSPHRALTFGGDAP